MTIIWMVGFVVISLVLLGVAIRRLRPVTSPDGTEWVDQFSMDRYRPLERILRERDYTFLRRQPGFDPSIERKLRKERREITRGYLRNLRTDFGRLYRAGVEIALLSNTDRSDLLSSLARLRFQFVLALTTIEIQLALNALGIGEIDLTAALNPVRDVCSIAQHAHSLGRA